MQTLNKIWALYILNLKYLTNIPGHACAWLFHTGPWAVWSGSWWMRARSHPRLWLSDIVLIHKLFPIFGCTRTHWFCLGADLWNHTIFYLERFVNTWQRSSNLATVLMSKASKFSFRPVKHLAQLRVLLSDLIPILELRLADCCLLACWQREINLIKYIFQFLISSPVIKRPLSSSYGFCYDHKPTISMKRSQ